jgi:hypothetical protein
MFFPDLARNPDELEYLGYLKQHTGLTLKQVQGDDTMEQLRKIDDYISSMSRPKQYDGAGGMEVQMKKSFTETCVLLSQHISADPKKMTVIEFYTALDTVRKQLNAR